MACGDLSAYDSDQTYPLAAEQKQYKSLLPTQEPINPPYKTACLLKKNNSLASSENSGKKCNMSHSTNSTSGQKRKELTASNLKDRESKAMCQQ